MEVPIDNNVSARVYKPSSTRRFFLLSCLVALYAIVLPYCYLTAGDPRRAAMINAQTLADEKWAAEAAISANQLSSNATESSETTFDSSLPAAELPTSTSSSETTSTSTSTSSASASASITEELEFDHDSAFDASLEEKKTPAKAASFINGWFGPSKEQKRVKKEFEEWQKQFNERNPDSPVSLPPWYLPSAWACLALFSTLTLHALFYLMCHWVVDFKAFMLYTPSKKVEEGVSILIVPPSNRGKAAMSEVKRASQGLQVEFQRQTYIYHPARDLGEQATKYPNGVLTLCACPVKLPLSVYLNARGLESESEIQSTLEMWGKNQVSVTIPSFFELLQLQLLSPLAIFQVFCALLWLLDEYWTYTLWTLASVVIFEATTVFQRTKTQKMLGGMAPIPSPIFVFRCHKWICVTTKDLLPGDLVSLAFRKRVPIMMPSPTTAKAPTDPSKAGGGGAAAAAGNNAAAVATPATATPDEVPPTSRDEVVPCDCLLLVGSAVVNEASLTGESVPQMKEAIGSNNNNNNNNSNSTSNDNDIDTKTLLDMEGANRVNTLYSGTSLITIEGSHAQHKGLRNVPPPPDHGAIAFVLRTGFSSSQGTLMQMIEFSQQSVTGDSRETGMALFLLFIFALIAAAYVLKEGLRKKEKTTHEILLKCVIIITSVVPRQFPMQMAMAVNMALMALFKAGIFCTEPFRVPLAGKISHCFFDKTGTLTTDQLVPVGIINSSSPVMSDKPSDLIMMQGKKQPGPILTPVDSAAGVTAMVLAACHSLVVVEDAPPASTSSTTNADATDSTSTSTSPPTSASSPPPQMPPRTPTPT